MEFGIFIQALLFASDRRNNAPVSEHRFPDDETVRVRQPRDSALPREVLIAAPAPGAAEAVSPGRRAARRPDTDPQHRAAGFRRRATESKENVQ
ncbi:MAG TPA: hypothetical protein VHC18_13865 [Amycolatopsis sp.]|nr:hypothetical protein [Amycolatopsis sp.]